MNPAAVETQNLRVFFCHAPNWTPVFKKPAIRALPRPANPAARNPAATSAARNTDARNPAADNNNTASATDTASAATTTSAARNVVAAAASATAARNTAASAADTAADATATTATATTTADDDEACALRAREGDTRALESLVTRHQDTVARLLWRFVRNRADLDDLVQETFLRMVRGLGGWRAEQPFAHWLLRIATNTGRDYFRRQSVRRRHLAEPDHEAGLPPGARDTAMPEAIDPAANPAARAAAGEVKEILAELPPDDRALLTLYYLEDRPLAEIAARFGWTVTATKLRAWRARARLRARLKERAFF
ncbi:MAG: sigma-70 family RNA polymerase sigma factor [Opitutaceae bacterium]|nr:sigma-70 family RNA polymerase sigma factor [Opitutaceae bacterium]